MIAAGWKRSSKIFTLRRRESLGLALGGIVTKPTLAVVGEAGPEAVIPLNKGKSMGTTININVAGSVFVEDLEQQIDFAVRRGIERYA